ncbi:hypothetical protein KC999_17980 [Proteus mirabilis]|uniref:ATP-grasp fold amidoligase family protein n=1 Tax=Morganellaceae TaxID=1903414 RepID=UPI00146DC069|nr:ATP-grasp fold amidoligase family protein [Providencia stuartii]NMT49438.1 hypothetical protein [Providencia stuartii]
MNTIDNLVSILAYIIKQGKLPRLIRPKTLTDKILFIKLRPNLTQSTLRKVIADRIQVRDYVKKNSQDCDLIPILWCGEELTLDVWNNLPEQFVIKANHGSKMVRIVNKNNDNFISVYNDTEKWKKIDYYKKGREWVYKDLNRKIIVEELINFNSDIPPDYKFFCLNGKVQFVQVDLSRFKSHKRNIYDKNFNLLDVEYQFPKGEHIKKPILYDNAVAIAEDLSKELDFIRVDLYILENKIYFGEMTNFPGNCLEKFKPENFDLEMGTKLVINKSFKRSLI